ncbi:MAG: copper homeostasis protein CutC, partial [Oscillospiraceae bacterium]|nr:copper homeostasis protein CutC [Oscillospiraceae bacterium]
MAEICCGSFDDAAAAKAGGADRVELNSALFLGGLTPSLATLRLVKKCLGIKTIAMVRPRGGGFCYTAGELTVMELDCALLMENGADGAAFGCLNPDGTVDVEANRRLVEIVHRFGGEAVFHRAFDCTPGPFEAIETLIELGFDRVLTSGQKDKAPDGAVLLKKLQDRYGDKIEILAGSGVSPANAGSLMTDTGITQLHSSCRAWVEDPTTAAGK